MKTVDIVARFHNPSLSKNIKDKNRWMRSVRANTIVRQYLILKKKKVPSHITIDVVLHSLKYVIEEELSKVTRSTKFHYSKKTIHSVDDLTQEAYIATVLCIRKFSLEHKSSHFVSYLRMAIKRRLRDVLKKSTRLYFLEENDVLIATEEGDEDGQESEA